MKKIITLLLLWLAAVLPLSAQQLDTLSLRTIFYEPLLAGHRPDLVRFSPDQTAIFYQANDSSMIDDELFRVGLDGENRQPANKAFDRDYKIAPNGQQIVYSEEGDLWLADPDFENARELVASDEQEYNPVWGPESNRIAFVQDGDVWIFNIKPAKLQQITNKKEEEARYSISEWAGPHKLILRQYDDSADKT